MATNKSLDEVINLIAALLYDVHSSHGDVFNSRARDLTLKKIKSRVFNEGVSFITKTLPAYGKALDRALSGGTPLDAEKLRLKPLTSGSKLPKLFGELTSRVLSHSGELLPQPCANCVRSLRQLLYCFYKYKLPYEDEECSVVVQKFERTEDDLRYTDSFLRLYHRKYEQWLLRGNRRRHLCDARTVRISIPAKRELLQGYTMGPFGNEQLQTPNTPRVIRDENLRDRVLHEHTPSGCSLIWNRHLEELPLGRFHHIRQARRLLSSLFACFDPNDIKPRHGPGAVSTKEQLWAKYQWTNVSANITRVYPLDAYFMASLGHVCDTYNSYRAITEVDHSARVVLVPKDSRGPRLISCEPVDYQWIQQGLGTAIVQLVERHPLTRENVRFTDQEPNRMAAKFGSLVGRYSTLDLNEASDRVSLDLVRLLFPPHICEYLEACRSSSTILPDGRVLKLRKFAPMGSCLCFPIMALTIWAILTAGTTDTDTRKSIYVYGDDVIVPTAYAANAIEQLESYGLKINHDKSCTSGLFRESCGMDAFLGVDVTPVRIKTVWSSHPSPDVYCSWIAYANSFYDRRCFATYDYIVSLLHHVYGAIPDEGMVGKTAPSLRVVADEWLPNRFRINRSLQKKEWLVWTVRTPSLMKEIEGWSMLLRYFAESNRPSPRFTDEGKWDFDPLSDQSPFSVRKYTRRRASMLVRRWR